MGILNAILRAKRGPREMFLGTTPRDGELIYETDLLGLVIGDGVTLYEELPYLLPPRKGEKGTYLHADNDEVMWKEVAQVEPGTQDYNVLINHPSINGIELVGDTTLEMLHIAPEEHTHSISDIVDFPSNIAIMYVMRGAIDKFYESNTVTATISVDREEFLFALYNYHHILCQLEAKEDEEEIYRFTLFYKESLNREFWFSCIKANEGDRKELLVLIFNPDNTSHTVYRLSLVDRNELSTVAFSGDYNDLINTPAIPEIPEIPVVNDAVISFTKNGDPIGEFTLNSNEDQTIEIEVPEYVIGNGKITIKQGNNEDSFTVNQTTNKTIELDPIPTVGSGNIVITQGENRYEFNVNQEQDFTIDLAPIPEIPYIPEVGDGTIKIAVGNTVHGTFTTNQFEDSAITLPSYPTVGNGQVVIKQGGVQIGSFSLNDSGNHEINIEAAAEAAEPDDSEVRIVQGDDTYVFWLNHVTKNPYTIDIKEPKDSTITFTQDGVTKGSITLNQSNDATIALDGFPEAILDQIDEALATIGNATITIVQAGTTFSDSFTVNQLTNQTITLPAPPAAIDSSLTIQRNNTTVGTFYPNRSNSGNSNINISVPEKTSDLTNDSGFITSASLPTVSNATVTIKQGTATVGSFTLNQGNNSIISLAAIPTIGSGVLTLKQGENTLGTFNANATSNATINIPVPPTPVTPNNGTLSINIGEDTYTFSADSEEDINVTIPVHDPTPMANNSTITLTHANGYSQSFTLDQASDQTIALPAFPELPVVNNKLIKFYIGNQYIDSFYTNSSVEDSITLPEYPTVPTPGDGTLTITCGGATLGTFSANQGTNKTIDIPYVSDTGEDLPIPNNPAITLTMDGETKGTFTLDQPDAVTIDLTPNYPTPPTVNNATINITQGGVNKGSFTLNQGNTATIDVDAVITDYNDLDNKPTIPTVNNATITFYQGSVNKGTITTNQGTASTITFDAIPTVGDATLTIKQGQSTLGSFKANAVTDKTITIPDFPALPVVNNATLSITVGEETSTFTANSSEDVSITIPVHEPTPPANDATITIKQGTFSDTFTVNQSTNKTITLPSFPTLPTVNNGKLTINVNNASVGSFTANQSGNTTVNLSIPTKTSDLTNDSGFLTSVGNGVLTIKRNNVSVGTFSANQSTSSSVNITVPTKTSEITNDSGFITSADIPSIPSVGNGIISVKQGATSLGTFSVNQSVDATINIPEFPAFPELPVVNNGKISLTVNNDTDNAVDFYANQSTNSSFNVNVPTNVSELNNDTGFITASDIPAPPVVNDATLTIQKNATNVGTFTANASQNKTINITVPTKTSDITNDSGFITLTDVPAAPVVNDGMLTIKQGESVLGTFSANQNSPSEIVIPDAPPAPNVGNATITIKQGEETLGSFTTNQNTNGEINIPTFPAIPTVNDSTITITRNSTSVGSFTTNSGTAQSIDIVVPTKTSDLTNDNGFITEDDLPSIPVVNNGALTIKQGSSTLGTFYANQAGATTVTIPSPYAVYNGTLTINHGNTTLGTFSANQSSNKTITIPAFPEIPAIPTNVSAFTNDAGYITSSALPTVNNAVLTVKQGSATLGTFSANQSTAATINIPEFPEIPEIPTDISAFNNDSGYITASALPTVNNGTLTIKQGNSTLGTFTANQSTSSTITIPTPPSIPTNVSTFTNDAGYITISDVPECPTIPTNVSAFNNDAGYITNAAIPVVNNAVLTIQKNSSNVGAFSANASQNATINITVPTKTSDITNDSGYITAADIPATPTIPTVNDATLTIKKNGTQVGTFTANASTNKDINITVPTKTSDLTNDSGFVTSVPAVGNGTLTIKQGTTQLGTFTANQSTNSTITIPAAPTVGDGTITINQGGVQKGTFTVNQSGNTTINLDAGGTAPTMAELHEGSGIYIEYTDGFKIFNTLSFDAEALKGDNYPDEIADRVIHTLSSINTFRFRTPQRQRRYIVANIAQSLSNITIHLSFDFDNIKNEQYLLIKNDSSTTSTIAFNCADDGGYTNGIHIIQASASEVPKNAIVEFGIMPVQFDDNEKYVIITQSNYLFI